jgi:hypothetical protein
MERINKNSVSLAGEFAVLSQLSLRGYDANMTLGRTKGIDILVYSPEKKRSFQLEVKTNFKKSPNRASVSKVHGTSVDAWMMNKKHESIHIPTLFYCFVNISRDSNYFKFYIVPSKVVARYVAEEHDLWLREKEKEGKRVKDTDMRVFRLGLKSEKYPIATPTAEQYQNNWNFAESLS